MILKTYFKHSIPFLPQRREYKQALEWLNQIRSKILSDDNPRDLKQDFGLTSKEIKHFKPDELKEIFDIITYTEFDNTYNPELVYDFFFDGDFPGTDSIRLPIIQKLIKKGLSMMQSSKDPIHGFTHAVRTARLARLIYQKLRPNSPDLDWGIIATAATWHDIYRVNHIGFLYSKNTISRKLLRQIDILQDIIIYSINKKDSFGSVYAFLKQNKKQMPKHLQAKIAIAILGGRTLGSLQEKIYPGIKTYKQIIEAADAIDMMSIGRWEEMHRKVVYRKQADITLLNRMIILNAVFNIKKILGCIKIKYARQIYIIARESIRKHGQTFYPNDAELFKIAEA